MTIHANKVNETSPNIKVQFTYGSLNASIEEHHSHVRSFHTSLGNLLDQMEAQAAEGKE